MSSETPLPTPQRSKSDLVESTRNLSGKDEATGLSYALLPAGYYHPLHLLWLVVLPQILVFAINAQVAWLVWEPLGQAGDRAQALGGLACSILLALGATVVAVGRWKKGLRLGGGVLGLGLLIQAGTLWLLVFLLGQTQLGRLPLWMLNSDQVLLAQFAGFMPGIFYALLGAACSPLPLSKSRDSLWSGALVFGVPLLAYLGSQLVRLIPGIWSSFYWVGISLTLLGTVVMMAALLRLLMQVYSWAKRFQALLMLVAALVLPVGGLLLNIAIPFPANFQLPAIYFFTLLNAAVLLAGSHPQARNNPWCLLAQAATFGFTLYFFIVFLPFLPLFLPAMLVAGAGFLILAPTILFVMHGQRLLQSFVRLRELWGLGRALPAMLLSMGLLPGWFVAQALLDRHDLRQALDYLYAPRLQPRMVFAGSPQRVGTTLLKLQDFKSGHYLPLLSPVLQLDRFRQSGSS
ncbi:MAG: MSEP-CTERM sorting domain-containing protein [Blastochloris sp.]|nr:MSEP-CTERM sorting domain-containing protein [Blastochloris sp.]